MNEEEPSIGLWYSKAGAKMLTWLIMGIILLTAISYCMKSGGLDDMTASCIIYGSIGSCVFVLCCMAAILERLKYYHPKSKLQLLEERVSELERMVK